MEKKRSVGVTIFGWLYIILSISGFMTAIAGIVEWQGMAYVLGAFIGAGVCLIMGISILKLKNWGRILVVCYNLVLVLLIIGRTIWLLAFTPESSLMSISFMAIVIVVPVLSLVIFFFIRPKVKEQFR